MVEAKSVQLQPNEKLDAEIEKIYEECGDYMQSYEDKTIRIELRFTKIKTAIMTFKFPADDSGVIPYPEEACVLELKSTTMPAKLTGLIGKRVLKHIEDLAKEGKEQVLSSYQFLANIMENNNLIPCWSEFAQIKSVIDATKGDTLKPFEKAGKLRVTLKEGDYSALLEFTVPAQYPQQIVSMKLISHNFNEVFAQIFLKHAENVIRRLWNGGEPGYEPGAEVDVNAGRVGYKKAVGAIEADLARIQVSTRAELQHDMNYIARQQALAAGPMDRTDRRQFKLNLKHEKRYEEEKKEKYANDAKMAESLDVDGQLIQVSANPQIYHAIKYMADYFVRFIPQAKCVKCQKPLMTNLKAGVDSKGKMPERAFCGHWLHVGCFEEYINLPPFKRECPLEGCTKKLASNNFPIDPASVKAREKRYIQHQQKAGEVDEMERLFGLV